MNNKKHQLCRTINYTIILLFILCLSHGWSATTGKIAGNLVDQKTGEALPGANVVLEGTNMGAATDMQGDYFIINVPPGNYSVKASMMGYQTITKTNVQVFVGRTTNLDFKLEPKVIDVAEEVTVVAERPIVEKDVTGTQQVIDSETIDRSPVIEFKDVIRQQTGVSFTPEATIVRGGLQQEVNYSVDGISTNSGLISDGWNRLNPTSIQEVVVNLGGYNAEFGQAMSGVVNIVTKEASTAQREYHGSLNYTYRPAGLYHWGKYMYDKDLGRTSYFDVNFWQDRINDPDKLQQIQQHMNKFYGWDLNKVPTAEEVREVFLREITPDEEMLDYNKRAQHDIEGTFFGSPFNKFSFLLSGKYKRGVGIYPQANPYNPEYTVQGKFNYQLSPDKKLTLNLLNGWYKTCLNEGSTLATTEIGRDFYKGFMSHVRTPYASRHSVNLWGQGRFYGPEEKDYTLGSIKWQHTINPSTFYDVNVSYIDDHNQQLPIDDRYKFGLDVAGWGSSDKDLSGQFIIVNRYRGYFLDYHSKLLHINGDFTSQINKNHQIKAGTEFKYYDLFATNMVSFLSSSSADVFSSWLDSNPYEFGAYVQDKMEYEGIILNIGLRLDAFDTNTMYPESIYDPMAIGEHNGGDGTQPSNTAWLYHADRIYPDYMTGLSERDFRNTFANQQDKMTYSPGIKTAISPRLGVSFPMTENSKLRFNYGHFYQRPSWNLMTMRAYTVSLPNSPDQPEIAGHMGYTGNPDLTYQKTVQYEIGYDHSLFDMLLINATAYVKDQTKMTRFSHNSMNYNYGGGFYGGSRILANVEVHDLRGNFLHLLANNSFRDVRGITLDFTKRFLDSWGAKLSFEYSTVSGGVVGNSRIYEDESIIPRKHGQREEEVDWLSNFSIKGNVNYKTPQNLGPVNLLGDITVGVYYEYFSGPEYTWYPRDYTGLIIPNNKRWYGHQRTDITLDKRFSFAGLNPIIGLKVFNVFNNYDRELLGGDELDEWEEDNIIPKNEFGETYTWGFYNSLVNPKRQIYLTIGFEF